MHTVRPIYSAGQKLSEREIIDGIKANSVNSSERRCFEDHFYYAHREYLLRGVTYMCMCSDLSEPAEHAKDITQDAFISAFESIGGFTLDGEANQNDHIHLVRGWLGKIANRHFLKLLRSRKKEDDAIQDHRERISSPPELILHENSGVKNTPSNNMFKIKYALSTLSDKQKDVILTYANEGCIGNDKHLSETAMAELCEFHKTNPVNVRKIKNRALKKVISLCPLS